MTDVNATLKGLYKINWQILSEKYTPYERPKKNGFQFNYDTGRVKLRLFCIRTNKQLWN